MFIMTPEVRTTPVDDLVRALLADPDLAVLYAHGPAVIVQLAAHCHELLTRIRADHQQWGLLRSDYRHLCEQIEHLRADNARLQDALTQHAPIAYYPTHLVIDAVPAPAAIER